MGKDRVSDVPARQPTSGSDVLDALEACASGRPEGRRQLEQARGQRLGQMVLRIVGDPRRAEAIVEATLRDAAGQAASYDPRQMSVDDWLFALARARISANAPLAARGPVGAPSAGLPVGAAAAQPGVGVEPRESFPLPGDVIPRRPTGRRQPAPSAPSGVGRLARAGLALVILAAASAAALVAQRYLQAGHDLASDPPHLASAAPPLLEPEQAALPGPPARQPAPVLAEAPAATAMAAPPRIVVHYAGGDRAGGRALLVADYLALHDLPVVEMRPVPLSIATRSVRYFHAADRDRAEAVAAALDRLDAGKPVVDAARLADFTHYVPKPQPGTIEIWLPAPPVAPAASD